MVHTHEIFVNKNGTASLRHLESGEVMHSNVGPEEEARLLYIEQSKLAEKLMDKSTNEPLVIFDMGLGAGSNALAALQTWKALPDSRPIHIVSFESDLDGSKLAFSHASKLPFFEGLESAFESLLWTGSWKSKNGRATWDLYAGDFRSSIVRESHLIPRPDLIFFDFYSPRTCPDLWSLTLFRQLRAHTHAGTELYTYSASTRVRLALALSGFFVGYGVNTGAKNETTVAANDRARLNRPLGEEWLFKLSRSTAVRLHGTPQLDEVEIHSLLLDHPQFLKAGFPFTT